MVKEAWLKSLVSLAPPSSHISMIKMTVLPGGAEEPSSRVLTLQQLVYQNVTVLLNGWHGLGSCDASGTPGAVGDEGSAGISNKSSESDGSTQTRENHGLPLSILQ